MFVFMRSFSYYLWQFSWCYSYEMRRVSSAVLGMGYGEGWGRVRVC